MPIPWLKAIFVSVFITAYMTTTATIATLDCFVFLSMGIERCENARMKRTVHIVQSIERHKFTPFESRSSRAVSTRTTQTEAECLCAE